MPDSERASDEPASPNDRPASPDVVRRLSIDEFTPIGTAVLLAIYFLILVLMWVFMYFVEFAGSSPHIIIE